jgi:hypothetical protein
MAANATIAHVRYRDARGVTAVSSSRISPLPSSQRSRFSRM